MRGFSIDAHHFSAAKAAPGGARGAPTTVGSPPADGRTGTVACPDTAFEWPVAGAYTLTSNPANVPEGSASVLTAAVNAAGNPYGYLLKYSFSCDGGTTWSPVSTTNTFACPATNFVDDDPPYSPRNVQVRITAWNSIAWLVWQRGYVNRDQLAAGRPGDLLFFFVHLVHLVFHEAGHWIFAPFGEFIQTSDMSAYPAGDVRSFGAERYEKWGKEYLDGVARSFAKNDISTRSIVLRGELDLARDRPPYLGSEWSAFPIHRTSMHDTVADNVDLRWR